MLGPSLCMKKNESTPPPPLFFGHNGTESPKGRLADDQLHTILVQAN